MEEIALRKATIGDCHDIWLWRNHPKVRKWHFNPKKIGYKTHMKWFEEKTGSDNACIYIAENLKKEKLGQIRMEMGVGESVYVTIDLNPKFFGRHIGAKIIRMGTDAFMRENPNVGVMAAEICRKNIASQRAFEKAGYALSHRDIKKGRRIVVCKLGKG